MHIDQDMASRGTAATTRAVCLLVGLALAGVTVFGYALTPGEPRWDIDDVPLLLETGTEDFAFHGIDGWNAVLGDVQFDGIISGRSNPAIGDGDNDVFWDIDGYGVPFNDFVWAYTFRRYTDGQFFEADVIFDAGRAWSRFELRAGALHEFGHVLGLSHPNQAGQSVFAVMNSAWDNDALTADDVAGGQALYGGPEQLLAVSFPPRDQTFQFRQELERKYRDDLRRQPTNTFVNLEGAVVWTQEYLRYRLFLCDAEGAAQRVFLQIDGRGIQPACGMPEALSFPPRDEPFQFRQALEEKYQYSLGSPPGESFVDAEGDVVWIQEYLRYRVTGCSHAEASQRVMTQIDGEGVPPACA
jgi:hypothetical protein